MKLPIRRSACVVALFALLAACARDEPAPESLPAPEPPHVVSWDLDWARDAVFTEVDVSDGWSALLERLNGRNDAGPAGEEGAEVGGLWIRGIADATRPPAEIDALIAAAAARGLRVGVDVGQDDLEAGSGAAAWLDRGVHGVRVRGEASPALVALVRSGRPTTLLVADGGDAPMVARPAFAEAVGRAVREGSAHPLRPMLDDLASSPLFATRTPREDEGELDGAARRLATSVLLTLPGTPFLRGSEVETGSALVRLRLRTPALSRGEFRLLDPGRCAESVLGFVRREARGSVVVMHNLGDRAADCGPYPFPHTAPMPVYATAKVAPPVAGPQGWTFRLPSRFTGIWRI